MITGAASSEAALLLIDANEGVQEQSRRHGYLLSLLGIPQVAVLVNKMDLVGYDAARFGEVAETYRAYLASIGVEAIGFIPISAREGDNIATHSRNMPWYQGPTVLQMLDGFQPRPPLGGPAARMLVQDVYKFDHRRIIAGRIEAGPSRSATRWCSRRRTRRRGSSRSRPWAVPETPRSAVAGESVGVTLETQIFVERGEVMSHLTDPPMETNVFKGRLFWLGRSR